MFGIEEVLIGSNTEKIVRLSNVPVLVIKKEHPKFTTANFVFASDFKRNNKKPFKNDRIRRHFNAKLI
jgi:hypothetical protein